MKSNKSTQHQIEETLKSLDGISRADMPPFFYTRLQARLELPSYSLPSFWLLITKPAVTLVTLSLFVILNIAAINYFIKSNRQSVSEATSGIQNFAQEYNLTGYSSVYNEKTTR